MTTNDDSELEDYRAREAELRRDPVGDRVRQIAREEAASMLRAFGEAMRKQLHRWVVVADWPDIGTQEYTFHIFRWTAARFARHLNRDGMAALMADSHGPYRVKKVGCGGVESWRAGESSRTERTRTGGTGATGTEAFSEVRPDSDTVREPTLCASSANDALAGVATGPQSLPPADTTAAVERCEGWKCCLPSFIGHSPCPSFVCRCANCGKRHSECEASRAAFERSLGGIGPCGSCDPSYGCFDGSVPCSKQPPVSREPSGIQKIAAEIKADSETWPEYRKAREWSLRKDGPVASRQGEHVAGARSAPLTPSGKIRESAVAILAALEEQPASRSAEALEVARRFHEAYERLAPSFGYETRTETREFDPTSANGQLMVAVCGEITSSASARIQELEEQVRRLTEDVRLAAGELLVEIPEPGSGMARVMLANAAIRRQREEARATVREQAQEIERLKERREREREEEDVPVCNVRSIPGWQCRDLPHTFEVCGHEADGAFRVYRRPARAEMQRIKGQEPVGFFRNETGLAGGMRQCAPLNKGAEPLYAFPVDSIPRSEHEAALSELEPMRVAAEAVRAVCAAEPATYADLVRELAMKLKKTPNDWPTALATARTEAARGMRQRDIKFLRELAVHYGWEDSGRGPYNVAADALSNEPLEQPTAAEG